MGPAADVRTRYDRFARVEAAGSSPSYQRLALAIAADEVAIDLIGRAEPAQRQPNLVLGVLRWHGVDVTDATAAVRWLVAHGEALLRELPTRRTQTNEVARCALLLPALAGLPGPLALVEVGASAGLCLRPDRWSYDYGTGRVEVAQPIGTLTCAASGAVPVPAQMPDVRWRMGLDVAPLDHATPTPSVGWSASSGPSTPSGSSGCVAPSPRRSRTRWRCGEGTWSPTFPHCWPRCPPATPSSSCTPRC